MPEESPPIVLSCAVDRYHGGWTLIDFLCDRFRYLEREIWVDRIAVGRVRVNGEPGHEALAVCEGDVVQYEVHVVEPPVDFAYDVVYEDDDLLSVSKSGNIPVHAGGKYFRHTLVAKLREDLGIHVDLAHRLDRETSGLVVLTKNSDAARALAASFSRRRVDKVYTAIVRGGPSEDAFTVDAPVARVGRDFPVARSVVDHDRGKWARTDFRVVERLREVAVVEARPLTGRRNQIRLHLEFAGHPIVGDKIYGMPVELLEERLARPGSARVRAHLTLPRHALHAWRMRLRHPRTGAPLSLEAPVPRDFTDFLTALRGRDAGQRMGCT